MGFLDERYPPKNRDSESLPILDIVVEDAQERHVFDPNGILVAVLSGKLAERLGATVGDSLLSGRPGYRFRDDDVSVVLTLDEIERLVGRELTPEEFFKLRERYGLFFPIHDDFYDPDTGEAWQPVGLRRQASPSP